MGFQPLAQLPSTVGSFLVQLSQLGTRTSAASPAGGMGACWAGSAVGLNLGKAELRCAAPQTAYGTVVAAAPRSVHSVRRSVPGLPQGWMRNRLDAASPHDTGRLRNLRET